MCVFGKDRSSVLQNLPGDVSAGSSDVRFDSLCDDGNGRNIRANRVNMAETVDSLGKTGYDDGIGSAQMGDEALANIFGVGTWPPCPYHRYPGSVKIR